MKSILKPFIAIFIIISISTTSKADNPPDFEIQDIKPPLLLTERAGLVKIDSGYKIKTILRDSTVADALLINIYNIQKIRIKNLSFSRHDTAYCFANKFPASDSLKWQIGYHNPDEIPDTIKLRDSILELKPGYKHNGDMKFFWHLKKKYTFNIGDTFSMVLAEIPDRVPPQYTLPQENPVINPVNSRQSRMFVLIDGYRRQFLTEEQTHFPLFDVSGKKQLLTPKSSFIFILPIARR